MCLREESCILHVDDVGRVQYPHFPLLGLSVATPHGMQDLCPPTRIALRPPVVVAKGLMPWATRRVPTRQLGGVRRPLCTARLLRRCGAERVLSGRSSRSLVFPSSTLPPTPRNSGGGTSSKHEGESYDYDSIWQYFDALENSKEIRLVLETKLKAYVAEPGVKFKAEGPSAVPRTGWCFLRGRRKLGGCASLVWTWVAGRWGPSARVFSLQTRDRAVEVGGWALLSSVVVTACWEYFTWFISGGIMTV